MDDFGKPIYRGNLNKVSGSNYQKISRPYLFLSYLILSLFRFKKIMNCVRYDEMKTAKKNI
jgi:hypothetical protein